MRALLTVVLLGLSLGLPLLARGQEATPPSRVEPRVQHIVVEDKGVRIEELRVRGQTQRIVVRPKTADVAPYEILPESPRDLSAGQTPSRGASGQRVWNVLTF